MIYFQRNKYLLYFVWNQIYSSNISKFQQFFYAHVIKFGKIYNQVPLNLFFKFNINNLLSF